MFFEKRNYAYFLMLLEKYLAPVADIYSYCLLPNHYHLILKTKDYEQLPKAISNGTRKLSQPFSNMFNAYAKAINKKYQRRGSLFQEHPKQIAINDDDYLRNLIMYVNTNSNHHNLGDYSIYPHSSYPHLISKGKTFLSRSEVIGLFGDLKEFKRSMADKKSEIEELTWEQAAVSLGGKAETNLPLPAIPEAPTSE